MNKSLLSAGQLHVLIRISATGTTDSIDDIVAAHRTVIKARGYVWFGMWKLRIAADRLELLKRQYDGLEPTYLYLVQRAGKEFSVYRATVTEISANLPPKSAHYVPGYYFDRKMLSGMGAWLKLKDFSSATQVEFERLRVSTTGRAVPELLNQSQVSFALVSSANG